MKGSETTKAGQENVEDGPVMDNSEFSGIRSESEVTGASPVGTSGLIPMEEVEQLNEDEPSSEIKGKGQLPQLLDECSKDPETACGREEDNGAGCVYVECMNAVFELPAITKLDLIGEKRNDIGVAAEVELTKTKAVEDKGLADALVVTETVDSAIDNMTKEDQVALSFFIDETHSPKSKEGSSNLVSTANQQNEVNGIQVQIGVTGSQDPVREAETVDAMDYSTEEAEVAVAGLSVKTVVHDQPFSLCADQIDSVKAIGSSSSQDAVKEVETVDTMDYSTKEVQIAVAGISVVHDQSFSMCTDEMNPVKTIESSGSQDPVREVETVDAMEYSTEEAEVAVAGVSVKTVVHDQPFSLCADQTNSIKAIESSRSQDAVKEVENVDTMDYSTKEVQVAVAGISIKAVVHDQPFPVCTDEMNHVKAIESSSNPAWTANQHEIRGAQVETGVTGNVLQQDSPHLPFVKNYLHIWEKIESMDAFKRYPQYPHFYPLVKCEELCREPIAIEKMMMFSALVDKIPTLQVENSRDFFHSSLKTLGELETFGFDVKEVRCFLNSLLEMRVKLEELQDQSKERELEVVKCIHDRTNNYKEICVVDKEIKDLQETLKVLEERRAVLMSMDVAKGSEISRLESDSSDITKSIQSIMRIFGEQVSVF